MMTPPGHVLVALDVLQKLVQRARDLALSSNREAEQMEAMRVRAARSGNLVEAELLMGEIKTTQAAGVRLRDEAAKADWRHREAQRYVDDLPEDTFIARTPEGPKPTADDPAAALGVRVVQIA